MTINVEITAFQFKTNLGWVGTQWSHDVLQRLSFGHLTKTAARESLFAPHSVREYSIDSRQANTGELSSVQQKTVDTVTRFLDGEPVDFSSIVIDMTGKTRFQTSIINACRKIGYGETCSYGELARRGGHANAARAVGSVMSGNTVPLIVPCHRVVPSGSRSFGGFSAPGGVDTKRRLLEMEGSLAVG